MKQMPQAFKWVLLAIDNPTSFSIDPAAEITLPSSLLEKQKGNNKIINNKLLLLLPCRCHEIVSP